jgi:hypothetical protein
MAHVYVNELNRFHEITDEGQPLVLVRGAWMDHSVAWQPVVPWLAESVQVLTFDRRSHGQSERPRGRGSRGQQEDDLATLIETLRLAPGGTEPDTRPGPPGGNGPEGGSDSSLSMRCFCCSRWWSRRTRPTIGRRRHEGRSNWTGSDSVPGDGLRRREARVMSRKDVHISTTTWRHRTLEAANG